LFTVFEFYQIIIPIIFQTLSDNNLCFVLFVYSLKLIEIGWAVDRYVLLSGHRNGGVLLLSQHIQLHHIYWMGPRRGRRDHRVLERKVSPSSSHRRHALSSFVSLGRGLAAWPFTSLRGGRRPI